METVSSRTHGLSFSRMLPVTKAFNRGSLVMSPSLLLTMKHKFCRFFPSFQLIAHGRDEDSENSELKRENIPPIRFLESTIEAALRGQDKSYQSLGPLDDLQL